MRTTKRLTVPVPQLLTPDEPERRAPGETGQPHADREVEPDDGVGRVEHEGAELPAVEPVHDPRLAGEQRLDRSPELVGETPPTIPARG